MAIEEHELQFDTISPTCAVTITTTTPPVHVYRLQDFSRATIDVWVDRMLEHLAAWDAHQSHPWLALHDLRAVSGLSSITPYVSQRFQDVAENYAHLSGRVCFVANMPRFLESLGRRVTYNFVNRNQPYITPHMVDDFSAGMVWLLSDEPTTG
jgi:hypothetical protein